jgi:hypothetical protein
MEMIETFCFLYLIQACAGGWWWWLWLWNEQTKPLAHSCRWLSLSYSLRTENRWNAFQTCGCLLWTRQWAFGFHITRGIS